MGLIPEKSFTVRKPAWWDTNSEYVLADYPGREEAMKIAGHDWDVIALDDLRVRITNDVLAGAGQPINETVGGNGFARKVEGYSVHMRSDTLGLLNVARESFERIQNSTAYDVSELLFDQGFVYETAGSMDGGKLNYITLLLNEPIIIDRVGELSLSLPFGCLSWAHDGTAALRVRSGTICQVCQNTVAASEAEGKALGTDFTFRHTKNVRDRIEDAKEAVRGVRKTADVYVKLMNELAEMPVTAYQRDLFVSEIVGDKNGLLSTSPATSDRVKNNIETERAKINTLFFGPTIPEAHRLTGYGLFQAGTEYADHLRNYRSKDSYVKRTLLSNNPMKAALSRTIREIVAG